MSTDGWYLIVLGSIIGLSTYRSKNDGQEENKIMNCACHFDKENSVLFSEFFPSNGKIFDYLTFDNRLHEPPPLIVAPWTAIVRISCVEK